MSYFHFPDNLDGCIEEEKKKNQSSHSCLENNGTHMEHIL